jgi:hypothetical protein
MKFTPSDGVALTPAMLLSQEGLTCSSLPNADTTADFTAGRLQALFYAQALALKINRAGLKISKALVQTCPWALLHVDKDESHHANMSMALLHDDRDVADSLSSSFMGQLGALFSELFTKFGPLLGWALGLRTHRTPSEPAPKINMQGLASQ